MDKNCAIWINKHLRLSPGIYKCKFHSKCRLETSEGVVSLENVDVLCKNIRGIIVGLNYLSFESSRMPLKTAFFC